MKIFKLPDLGEGLPEAEIHEWHVQPGDKVEVDQPLVAMETAKALVEVPAPRAGIIAKLYGKPGDIIKTNTPLVEFTSSDEDEDDLIEDTGATVAGHIEVGQTVLNEAPEGLTIATTTARTSIIPALRALAKRLQVDLQHVRGSGPQGRITADDIKRAAHQAPESSVNSTISGKTEPLRGVRRAMLQTMVAAHQRIVPTTILDDVDIQHWPHDADLTVRILQAVAHACQIEPALNAHFDDQAYTRTLADQVNIGVAMDADQGLFVPVIKQANLQHATVLRETINRFKAQIKDRSIPAIDLQGATITISNFGVFAGRYANPIIIPPMVAILGIGRLRQAVKLVAGTCANHNILPLSLTFDHRAITGGEATRFLGAVMAHLSQ